MPENNDSKFVAVGIGSAAVGALIAKLLTPTPAKASGGASGIVMLDDNTRQAIAIILDEVNKTSNAIEALSGAIAQITEKLGITVKPLVYVPFEFTLNPGQAVRLYEDKPLIKGTVRSAQLHFPDGCNGLVDVAAWYGNTAQLVPQTGSGYVALNDATPTYYINQEKLDTIQLWTDMRNRDAVNPHHIVVNIGVEVN
jgi:hypothetical protein